MQTNMQSKAYRSLGHDNDFTLAQCHVSHLARHGDGGDSAAGLTNKGTKMSEHDDSHRRNGDKSRISALANSPTITLAARIASVLMALIVSLLAFIASGSLKTMEKISDKVDTLSEKMIFAVTRIEAQDKRIEKVENKVFK